MIPSVISCPDCGSTSSRRSRRHGWFEAVKMTFGIYPFRCLDCNLRFWASVWMFSRLHYAKCPKCLGLELTGWPRRHYHLGLWRNLFATFGAHRYRCSKCRYNFLSFRPSYRRALTDDAVEEEVLPLETAAAPDREKIT